MSALTDRIHPYTMAGSTWTQSGGQLGHICNCIGCCKRCGTCRTWHGHTQAYCDLIVRQRGERAAFMQAS